MKRRHFLAGVGALGLGGCSISRTVERVANSVEFAIDGLEGVPLTREKVAGIPYATMMGKIGRGPLSLVVLGRIDGQDLHWISADRNVFVTRGGRLMKTVGLPGNIQHTLIAGQDPLAAAITAGDAERLVRYVDVMPGNYFGAGVVSRYEVLGPERIEILGLTYDTILVRERNRVPTIGWNHTNLFWIGRDDGFVWRSEQHFAPDLPPVLFWVTKPAAI